MKKFSILALALVLTAAVFTGCRNRNTPANTTPSTTVAPTTHATTEPTRATTHATTEPHVTGTEPSTHETIDNGNGPLENGETEGTGAAEGRARQHIPNSY